MNIAQFIDHTILKAITEINDINRICEEALTYHFAAVCIPPVYVKTAASNLLHSPVKVATVIGFPFGYHCIPTKVTEAKLAITDGAHELDMVMNIAAFKNKDWKTLEEEIAAVLKVAKENNTVTKVIIESGIWSKEEIIQCCEFYRQFNIDFLKTSTGYGERNATVEAVQIMREHLPPSIQIKASGGIKTYKDARQLIEAGATRLGCSASVPIVQGEIASGDY